MPFIELKEITKVYGQKETQIVALQQVSFALEKNELVVILGASGAGKSTLLNILGGMDYATSGSYKMNGKDITQLNEKELAQFRRRQIGFVFQFYNLMPNLTALENVRLSIEHLKDVEDPKHTLEMVGLGHRMHNFPSHLSGGEQQRVSIARAIVKKPDLLLCDEPTGALDSQTGKHILRLLKSISETGKQCVVIVTHNASIAEVANRVIRFSDGKLVSNQINLHPKDIEEIEW